MCLGVPLTYRATAMRHSPDDDELAYAVDGNVV